ncbi:MAG: DUF1015 domain-containing protein [Deltaproteobacteria bacterium]|nr:DUF1015 domain-containing protein [Deltaproteobacteria bacterium]
MAVLRPFRGVRYDRAQHPDPGLVLTQPYDRISKELQATYYARHPHCFVRLILGQSAPTDGDGENVYTRARATYREWLARGVLVPEPEPALYVYHQTFRLPDGSERTRRAVLGAFELSSFEEGLVLPHERTLSGPKEDRLKLLRATTVSLEPVFLLYPDPERRVASLLDAAIAGKPPVADGHELYEAAVRQELWVVTEREVLAAVAAELSPKRGLIIADGHHRYETALTYRDERRAAMGSSTAPGPHDVALAALVGMEDPGLAILPTHRLVHGLTGLEGSELVRRGEPWFAITALASRRELETRLAALSETEQGFGVVAREGQWLFCLKSEQTMAELVAERAPAWRSLEVSVLHELVLERLLGLTKESITRQENLRYLRELDAGYTALDNGGGQLLFTLRPTRMAQVAACAAAGEKMPQKSTDFYPKLASGLVALPLDAAYLG